MEHGDIAPVVLEAKEGLALINGTQYMTSLGALALLEAERLCTVADVAGSPGSVALPRQIRGGVSVDALPFLSVAVDGEVKNAFENPAPFLKLTSDRHAGRVFKTQDFCK